MKLRQYLQLRNLTMVLLAILFIANTYLIYKVKNAVIVYQQSFALDQKVREIGTLKSEIGDMRNELDTKDKQLVELKDEYKEYVRRTNICAGIIRYYFKKGARCDYWYTRRTVDVVFDLYDKYDFKYIKQAHILTVFMAESDFNPFSVGPVKEVGVGQIRPEDQKMLLNMIGKPGGDIKNVEINTECGLQVFKLKESGSSNAKGNIVAYNGNYWACPICGKILRRTNKKNVYTCSKCKKTYTNPTIRWQGYWERFTKFLPIVQQAEEYAMEISEIIVKK